MAAARVNPAHYGTPYQLPIPTAFAGLWPTAAEPNSAGAGAGGAGAGCAFHASTCAAAANSLGDGGDAASHIIYPTTQYMLGSPTSAELSVPGSCDDAAIAVARSKAKDARRRRKRGGAHAHPAAARLQLKWLRRVCLAAGKKRKAATRRDAARLLPSLLNREFTAKLMAMIGRKTTAAAKGAESAAAQAQPPAGSIFGRLRMPASVPAGATAVVPVAD